MSVRVAIDGVRVECIESPKVVVSYDANVLSDIELARKGRVVEVTLELDDIGESIFAGEGYLHICERFNARSHTGRIEYDGEVIIEGAATLRSIKRSGSVSRYVLLVQCASGAFAEVAATTLISLLPVEFSTFLRQADIVEGWGDEELPVQFFPVHRDDYESSSSSVEVGVVRRLRGVDDYHPFLKVDEMVRAVARQTGYSVSSSLLESEGFKSLYMSGAYRSQYNDVARAAMDFKVKKSESATAVADFSGRVSISPYIAASAISSIVDIGSLEGDSECFETNDCLSVVDGAVTFTPTKPVSVGFEFRLKYITDYKIISRSRLRAFDRFYLGEAPTVQIEIANLFTDERGEAMNSGMEYLVVAFDHVEGQSYRLVGRVDGAEAVSTLATWDERTVRFTSYFDESITDLAVELLGGSEYVEYDGDWALYQGYVTEEGQTQVDLTLRTSPDNYSPESPKSFGTMFFEGAEEGMSLTLLAGTSITPYFSGYPGYGESVSFEDLAQGAVRQKRFLESIMQLFNMRLFVDDRARTIYIDPLDEIYDTEQVWDWSSRVVRDREVVLEDCALEVSRSRTFGYQPNDGVTNRMSGFYYAPSEDYPPAPESDPEQSDERATSPDYGAWQLSIGSYAAKSREESILNPLFSPTQNTLSDVMIVGDRDDVAIVDTLEFSPRIVRWCGTTERGEPSVSFHNADVGQTLCFEDRDGVRGLNQYYAKQIELEERGQHITLSLRLSPNELLSLFSVVEGMPSLLSTFRFKLWGEYVECRIVGIEDYVVGGEGVARVRVVVLK